MGCAAAGVFGMRSMVWMMVFISSASLLLRLSSGAVYTVGDSAGWTTIGNVDYKNWASNISFQVGDIILFVYNPQFHDVVQISSYDGYKSCNASSPIATHTTGNDSISITGYGHHFFLCGFPGHCQEGQKVDINVVLAPAIAPSPCPPTHAPTAPAPSDASPRFPSNGFFLKAVAALSVTIVIANTIKF